MSEFNTDALREEARGVRNWAWQRDRLFKALDEIDRLREVMALGVPDEAGTIQRTKEKCIEAGWDWWYKWGANLQKTWKAEQALKDGFKQAIKEAKV